MDRFLALALCIVAAVLYCQAEDVEKLIEMAKEADASFTETSLKRLEDSSLWGAKRADRTTDVIVMNPSYRNFQVKSDECSLGALNSDLLPEDQIKSGSSSVYGMDSSQEGLGVQCVIEYEAKESDSFFRIILDNPDFGDNSIRTRSTHDLKVFHVLGHGHNNQVQITV